MKITALKSSKGFTLVELLIVIAVIGVLAAVILAVINPLEQLARGRDTGRKGLVRDLASSVQRYFTTNSAYPTADATWVDTLVTAGEVRDNPPANSLLGTPCGTGVTGTQDGYCFVTGGTPTEFIVYTALESAAANSLCANAAAPADRAWEVWSSADGRGGVVCTVDDSTPPAVGTQTYLGT